MTTTGILRSPSSRATVPAARFDSSTLVALAEVVDRDGLDAHAATLSHLADCATQVGVSPVLVEVMLGAGEPPVARLRAFARVGSAVTDHRRTRTTASPVGVLVAA